MSPAIMCYSIRLAYATNIAKTCNACLHVAI